MDDFATGKSARIYAHLPIGIWLILTPWYMAHEDWDLPIWAGITVALIMLDFVIQIGLVAAVVRRLTLHHTKRVGYDGPLTRL